MHRQTELGIYKDILTKEPTFRQAKYSTVVALGSLGRLKTIGGDVQGALNDLGIAAEGADALLINERENMDLTAVVGVTQIELGEALLATGQLNAARVACNNEVQRSLKRVLLPTTVRPLYGAPIEIGRYCWKQQLSDGRANTFRR